MLSKSRKTLTLVLTLFVCVSALTGCSTLGGTSDVDDRDLAVENTDDQTDEKHHNLSVDGPFQVSENMNNDTSFVLEQYLETNSHEITITNNSEVPVVINLYSDTDPDPDNPIRQLPLDSAETNSFTGLTSRFQYRIGVSADTSTQINLTITD